MVAFHEVEESLDGESELGIGVSDDGLDGVEEPGIELRQGRGRGFLNQSPNLGSFAFSLLFHSCDSLSSVNVFQNLRFLLKKKKKKRRRFSPSSFDLEVYIQKKRGFSISLYRLKIDLLCVLISLVD